MGDHIVRATAADLYIRAFAADTREMVEEARQVHGLSKVTSAALGRTMTAAAMMGSMMKGDKDLMTVSIRSDGPIQGMTVTVDSHGNVKGYANYPQVIVPNKADNPLKIDVGAAVGRGVLTVTQDLGLKEPYTGQVELQTGEIGDDFAYYFTVSEQTPSAVGLGVKIEKDLTIGRAGGFIIQLMPDCPEEAIEKLEANLAKVKSVTDLLDQGMGPKEILELLLGDQDLVITEDVPVRFHCGCSKDKFSRALATLSEQDLEELITGEESLEIKCQFCNSAYNFSVAELNQILAKRRKKGE